jgi:gamma-glutamyltranspeptidase/glutathione hydrolase
MTPPAKGDVRTISVQQSRHGMVSTASAPATLAGVRMLERGGNAVDAAVAAALCIGSSEPQSSGIGGQSMALVHLARRGRTVAMDGSSRAPFAIDPMHLPAGPTKVGLAASTVPSTVATLGWMLQRYGTLPLSVVIEPAIEAASEGVPVSALQHRFIKREAANLGADELASHLFLPGGEPLPAGAVLRQPQLAACLGRLAREGWREFYEGAVGAEILEDMEARGGLLTRADLLQIPYPVERPVLESRYRGYRLATFPPPGAGRALVQIMNILETFDRQELDLERPLTHVVLAHVFMNALRNRDKSPVDPDLYLQTRRRRMVDKRVAERIAGRIARIVEAGGEAVAAPAADHGETTHLTAADADGNVVGITQSIELVFGAKRLHPTLGFFYNNYMNTFEYRDMSHPYYLLPGAQPWSSVAPTLVSRRATPLFALGSPGSERIATALAQVLLRTLDHGQDLADAIDAPRLHASQSGTIQIERRRFPPQVVEALTGAGFKITRRGAYSFYLGCVQAIRLPQAPNEQFVGVADPRRDGTARGPSRGQPE